MDLGAARNTRNRKMRFFFGSPVNGAKFRHGGSIDRRSDMECEFEQHVLPISKVFGHPGNPLHM